MAGTTNARWPDFLLRLNAIAVYLFLYLPIALLVLYSFSGSRFSSVWGGFSVEWYLRLIRNENLLSALGNSLVLATCSSAVATVIGTTAALGVHRLDRRLRGMLETLRRPPAGGGTRPGGITMGGLLEGEVPAHLAGCARRCAPRLRHVAR